MSGLLKARGAVRAFIARQESPSCRQAGLAAPRPHQARRCQDPGLNQVHQAGSVIKVIAGSVYVQGLIGGHGQEFFRPAEEFAADGRPVNLDLGLIPALIPLGNDEIDVLNPFGYGVQGHFPFYLFDEGHLRRRRNGHHIGAGLGMAPGIFTGPVDVKAVGIMLDGCHPVTPPFQFRQKLDQQGRLAGVRLTDNRDNRDPLIFGIAHDCTP
ncbi:predicted glutamine amidotransferase [Moorella thermoacetica Y72]|uniref:Predicted glutamine amidotransferase n=1 Tax=Moorella thermoacetica Y72 TaxID=1325331 RepID=A0A0S6UBJ0_NEOTH|nr:predicted glutamine amidotransferase [Moorella thermoacetica Y72]